MRTGRMVLAGVAAAAAVAALAWSLAPAPVSVDLVPVTQGPLAVTVAAEGITRVRDTWSVAAPIAGTVGRSPVRVGDPVTGGETVVAQIRPAPPGLLDARSRAQAEAAVTEAEALVRQAEVLLARAEADHAYADAQMDRNRALAARGTIPLRALEDSEQRSRDAAAAADAARFNLDMRRAALARMRAQLDQPDRLAVEDPGECCVPVLAPHSGTVLEVADPSARPVQAGAPLLTIGDLADLQIEVDLLSSDAVRVEPGARAIIERWGGDAALDARVVAIDPAAFTRVSALGIEEQRVRVTLDIDTPFDARRRLGDRFRVFVRIVVWEAPDAVQVPHGALFREGEGWAVFRASGGRALRTPVTVGQSGEATAQILSGLNPGDLVVAYPGNRLEDGDRIAARD